MGGMIYRLTSKISIGVVMGGNSFGKIFRITTFGESHGAAVGVVIDGVPAGMPLNDADVQRELDRRRPGQSVLATPRRENDRANIMSGIFRGKTLGTPIAMIIQNRDADSRPYEEVKNKPRPGHADLTYWLKFGHADYRGGGRSSARETVGRVAAGAIAKKLLAAKGIEILGHTVEAAGVAIEKQPTPAEIRKNAERNPVRCADMAKAELMKKAILRAAAEGDSTGGIVEIQALGVPAGLGEPVFGKLDAEIAGAMMSIGAVKAVMIGGGCKLARVRGSEANDAMAIREGKISFKTNNSGGILGGISTGMPVVVRLAVKPTSSIAKSQSTVDLSSMKEAGLALKGRHDPNICPRIVPVAEAMLALVIADQMLRAGKINPDRFE